MSSSEWRPSYNVDLLRADMARRGWLATHLARHAKVSDMTVSRFLSGSRRTAPVAKKLAKALGHPIDRYLVSPTDMSAAS